MTLFNRKIDARINTLTQATRDAIAALEDKLQDSEIELDELRRDVENLEAENRDLRYELENVDAVTEVDLENELDSLRDDLDSRISALEYEEVREPQSNSNDRSL